MEKDPLCSYPVHLEAYEARSVNPFSLVQRDVIVGGVFAYGSGVNCAKGVSFSYKEIVDFSTHVFGNATAAGGHIHRDTSVVKGILAVAGTGNLGDTDVSETTIQVKQKLQQLRVKVYGTSGSISIGTSGCGLSEGCVVYVIVGKAIVVYPGRMCLCKRDARGVQDLTGKRGTITVVG